MSKGKRIGYGVLSLLPLLFMLLIQVLGGQIIYAAVTVYMLSLIHIYAVRVVKKEVLP